MVHGSETDTVIMLCRLEEAGRVCAACVIVSFPCNSGIKMLVRRLAFPYAYANIVRDIGF